MPAERICRFKENTRVLANVVPGNALVPGTIVKTNHYEPAYRQDALVLHRLRLMMAGMCSPPWTTTPVCRRCRGLVISRVCLACSSRKRSLASSSTQAKNMEHDHAPRSL